MFRVRLPASAAPLLASSFTPYLYIEIEKLKDAVVKQYFVGKYIAPR
jgi:hypothetical protein